MSLDLCNIFINNDFGQVFIRPENLFTTEKTNFKKQLIHYKTQTEDLFLMKKNKYLFLKKVKKTMNLVKKKEKR